MNSEPKTILVVDHDDLSTILRYKLITKQRPHCELFIVPPVESEWFHGIKHVSQHDFDSFQTLAMMSTHVPSDAIVNLVKNDVKTLHVSDILAPLQVVVDVMTLNPDVVITSRRTFQLINLLPYEKKPEIEYIDEVVHLKQPIVPPLANNLPRIVTKTFCDDTPNNPIYWHMHELIIPLLDTVTIDGKTYTLDSFEEEFPKINKKALKEWMIAFLTGFQGDLRAQGK